MRTLILTAVPAERDAVLAALPTSTDLQVEVCGVGPVQAAVGAAAALARAPYDLVLCAGVAGGFAPLAAGDVAVASGVVFADLGAQDADGSFLPAGELGLGTGAYDVAPKVAIELADRTGGRLGTILTVGTVTGTAARAAELQRRFPDAVAEAMEGAGVAAAAAGCGVPFGEIRTVSNVVGPRDRSAWQLPAALEALGRAVATAVARS